MDNMLYYQIAKAYYLEDLGQQEIADRFGLSRPKVSRMLKEARERGIVRITVAPPVDVTPDFLPQQLMRLLNIRRADVVDTLSFPADNLEQRLHSVEIFAAGEIPNLIKDAKNVGIGWGTTLYKTVMEMDYKPGCPDACFVPLVGNAGFSESAYQTNSIVERISEKLRGKRIFLNVPAFVPESELRRLLTEGGKMNEIGRRWKELDAALFSVGCPLKDCPVIKSEIGSAGYIRTLLAGNPVGDILGHCYDRDGKLVSDEDIGITIPREDFSAIPDRICLAAGENKTLSLFAAARMGLYTHLITDTYTAMDLIRMGSVF